MKKVISVFMAMMIWIFCLSGCSYIAGLIEGENEERIMLDSILDAIEKQDAEALRNLFSPVALQNAEYLDEGIAYVFELFTGEVSEIDSRGSMGSDDLGRDITIKTLEASFYISTTTGGYGLTYSACTQNDKYPQQVGLQKLYIAPMGADDEWGYELAEFMSNEFVSAGIYEPGRYPLGASEYTNEMYEHIRMALDNRDSAMLKSLFSQNVQYSVIDLDEQIEKAMDYFERPITSYSVGGHNVSARNNHTVIYAETNMPVTTDKGNYWLEFRVCFLNEADPDDVGLVWLVVKFEDDWISGADLSAFKMGVLTPSA